MTKLSWIAGEKLRASDLTAALASKADVAALSGKADAIALAAKADLVGGHLDPAQLPPIVGEGVDAAAAAAVAAAVAQSAAAAAGAKADSASATAATALARATTADTKATEVKAEAAAATVAATGAQSAADAAAAVAQTAQAESASAHVAAVAAQAEAAAAGTAAANAASAAATTATALVGHDTRILEAKARADEAYALAQSASGDGVGGSPPLASAFSYWLRRTDTDVEGSVQSEVTDRLDLNATEFDILGRINDKWTARFVGMDLEPGPSELICAIEPTNSAYFPFVKYGPMLLRSDTRMGVWPLSQAGRGDPSFTQVVEKVFFPAAATDATVSDTVIGIRAWPQPKTFWRLVYDADGWLTVFSSLFGRQGPWQLFHYAKMDYYLGGNGTGTLAPDKIGFCFTPLQEASGATPFRENFLCTHWELHAYTGPVLPKA